MLLQSYTLNMIPSVLKLDVMVNVSQYDADSRTIRMTLYNGETPFRIPSGASVFVMGTKADNTGYQYECEYTENTNVVTFLVKPQMTVLPGVHTAEIRIQQDEVILGTANFKFNVERGALQEDTVISETDLPLVEQAAQAVTSLQEVTDAIETANETLGRTDTAIENATEVLENVGPVAEQVQANAESAAASALAAETAASNASASATQAETSATNAGNSASSAAASASTATTAATNASGSAASAHTSEVNAAASAASASASESSVQANALKSEGFAVGEQNGTPVSSDSPYYHNNAKYYNTEASTSASNAHTSELNASGSASTASTKAGEASSSALSASNSATTATNKANEASNSATTASTKANEASASATTASTSATNAANSASSASTNALKSEGFAVGQQNGTDVSSDSPYYENNAKYYAEKAEDWADEAQTVVTNKADKDGIYPDMSVGNVLSNINKDDIFTYQGLDYDGLARINSIKGNTLVWNQLAREVTSTYWMNYEAQGSVISFSDNSVSGHKDSSTSGLFDVLLKQDYWIPPVIGHKYLFLYDVQTTNGTVNLIPTATTSEGQTGYLSFPTKTNAGYIWNCQTNSVIRLNIRGYTGSGVTSAIDFTVGNIMCFDLTKMFGSTIADQIYAMEQATAGSGVAYFRRWFNLLYYGFDPGSLLSFNGTGVKITGKNLVAKNIKQTTNKGIAFTPINETQVYIKGTSNGTYAQPTISDTFTLPAGTYRFSIRKDGTITNDIQAVLRTSANVDLGNASLTQSRIITLAEDTSVKWTTYIAGNNAVEDGNLYVQIEYGNVETDYVPYIAPYTLSLPISTYFPTGMKSAGTVYDELLPDKAITRIGAVDLGSLDWNYVDVEGHLRFVGEILTNVKLPPSGSVVANAVCAKYETVTEGQVYGNQKIGICITELGRAMVYDTTYSTAAAFKTAMSGVYLDYELATPTETDIDIDLSYRTYKGGTEQLLPENTSTPTTSPMSRNVTFYYPMPIEDSFTSILNNIAQVETSPTTHAYSVGQYLIYNGQLYKVTSSIANGGTLTVGTNITATTVMSELLSLTA